MVLPCVGLQRSIIYNVLWLVFALSFLWFPYIGMVTLPCRRKPLRRHAAPRIREPLVDYTQVGEESRLYQQVSVRTRECRVIGIFLAVLIL